MDAVSCSKFLLSAVVAAVLTAHSGDVHAKTFVDGIAIVVNDSIVTLSEYKRKEKMIKNRLPETSGDEIINSFISEILIEQAARKNGIKVSKEEIMSSVADFKKSLNLDDEELVKMLGERDTTFKEFSNEMKLQILTRKLVQSEVARKGLSLDDKRVEEVYKRINPNASRAAQVRIAHILMRSGSRVALEKAKQVAETARNGEKAFGELANMHSVDATTAERGGDLGYFKYDELIKPLYKAVDGADTGDINGPVESRAGFHIVKVLAIKPEGVLIPPEIKGDLVEKMAMQETELILSSLIERGFNASHIEVKIPEN